MRCNGSCSCGETCCLWEGHEGSCVCTSCDAGPKKAPKNRNPWGSSLCPALFLTIPTDAWGFCRMCTGGFSSLRIKLSSSPAFVTRFQPPLPSLVYFCYFLLTLRTHTYATL